MSNFVDTFGNEYAFLDTNEHLGKNVCLLGYGGSKAYGTNLPTSDTDIRGIATKRPVDILTNQNFEQVTESNTDTVIYAVDKYISLASDCNPNTIELMGLREKDYLYKNRIGEMILENKDMFLSNKAIKTFGGYATNQLYRLKQRMLVGMTIDKYNDHISKVITNMKDHLYRETGISEIDIVNTENGLIANISEIKNIPVENLYNILNEINNVIKTYNQNSVRNSKAIMHEKIEKHGMHLLRLNMMLEDMLLKGEIITYREKEHDLLMAIRNKEFTDSDGRLNEEFFELVDYWEDRVNKAKNRSVLPDKPDYKRINNVLMEINKAVISEEIMDYDYEDEWAYK